MKGTIGDIWDIVEETVDENLETILESDIEEGEESQLSENDLEEKEDELELKYPADWNLEDEDEIEKIFKPGSSAEDNLDYWMQEFDKILGEYVPITAKEKPTNGLTPILLGGGGIMLLGLITSVAVVIRVKRNTRRFRALPVLETEIEDKNPAKPEELQENLTKRPPMPFFHFKLPIPLLQRREGVS